jgi:hypothetical protein
MEAEAGAQLSDGRTNMRTRVLSDYDAGILHCCNIPLLLALTQHIRDIAHKRLLIVAALSFAIYICGADGTLIELGCFEHFSTQFMHK